MIVVDANVVAYLFIEGEKTELAQRLRQQDPEWILPSLWRHEFLNILATFVKYGGGEVTDALSIWQQSINLLQSPEQDVDMAHALQLALANAISAYDTQFVALAMTWNLSLVTEDQKLQQAFPGVALSMRRFLEAEA